MHAVLVEDAQHLYAGHPKELAEALDDIEDIATAEPDGVVDLRSPDRDAAWAALGGG